MKKIIFLLFCTAICSAGCVEQNQQRYNTIQNNNRTSETKPKPTPKATKMTTWGEYLQDNYLCWRPCDVEISREMTWNTNALSIKTKDPLTGSVTHKTYNLPSEGWRPSDYIILHSRQYYQSFRYVYEGSKRYECVTYWYTSGVRSETLVRIGSGRNSDILYYVEDLLII